MVEKYKNINEAEIKNKDQTVTNSSAGNKTYEQHCSQRITVLSQLSERSLYSISGLKRT